MVTVIFQPVAPNKNRERTGKRVSTWDGEGLYIIDVEGLCIIDGGVWGVWGKGSDLIAAGLIKSIEGGDRRGRAS